MPFIRHTRDKRGYETTFVMHGYRPAQGPQRTRVLYLFRSPSHLKLGRRPLDEESREALEHTHPDLSFDWSALARESAMVRTEEPRERTPERRRERPQGQQRSAPAPAPPPVVVEEDGSLLGRTLGAEAAARLRARYSELLQRIVRRSRTPEERDRLTDQAQRLNPDGWSDAETIRAQAGTVEAEWDGLVGALPARRRGRRGGRRREGRGDSATAGNADQSSAIMSSDGEIDASPEEPEEDVARSDRSADAGPDDRGGGPEHAGGAAGHDVSSDDEFRRD